MEYMDPDLWYDTPEQQQIQQQNHTKQYLIVIIYDIIDNKRRYRLAKVLMGYGKRVQRSAFECILTNGQYESLSEKLMHIVQPQDLLRVYKVSCSSEIKMWGEIQDTTFESAIIL